jgi:phosphatidate cytidylyltransferase
MGLKRVLTSIVLIPILFVVVWLLPPAYFVALMVVAAAVGQHELYSMAQSKGIRPVAALGMALGALVIVLVYRPLYPFSGEDAFFWVTLCLLAIMSARLFARRPVDGALEDIAVTVMGILYVAMLFGYQVAIHAGPPGKKWLVLLYLVIWASDTAAYYVGTAFGKHRLYEKVSPKKSIEGLAGGVLASVAVALLCSVWLVPSLSIRGAAVLGSVLALVGTVGDLAESLVKRSVGVKDSGAIIPGHGGVLDRMDSMLFAAPVAYYYYFYHVRIG